MLKSLLAALAVLPALAFAQAPNFPSHPVRLIVPTAAGGPSDIIGRFLAQKLSDVWKQPVVVENRAGVNGLVGAEAGAKATADGYTLLLGNSGTHIMNYGLYKKLPYDPLNGFAVIGKLGTSPAVLVTNPATLIGSVSDLINRPNSNSINFAAAGATATYAALLFNSLAKTKITVVPYKGGAPADLSILQNETQVSFTSLAGARGHIAAGKMKVLAVTTLARDPMLPDVPTLDESGIKGYDIEFWTGLFAPVGTPQFIIDKIGTDVARLLENPEIRRQLNEVAFSPAYQAGATFGGKIKADATKYARLMRELGIPAE